MTVVQQTTVSLPGGKAADLTLAPPRKQGPQRQPGPAPIGAGPLRQTRSEAADPGLIEYASWMQHLHPARP